MTHKEFTLWLQGFLDASTDLTVEGVDLIKDKLKEVTDICSNCPSNGCVTCPNKYIPYNDYPDVTLCSAGGQHEYPDFWHGIIPPPCKKCGMSLPSQQVIYCDTNSDNCCLNPQPVRSCCEIPQGMSYVEFSIPAVGDAPGSKGLMFKVPIDNSHCNITNCCMSKDAEEQEKKREQNFNLSNERREDVDKIHPIITNYAETKLREDKFKYGPERVFGEAKEHLLRVDPDNKLYRT